jgi:hypothetical protein
MNNSPETENETKKIENPRKDMLLKIKDRAIFIGWIGGLILIGGLFWVFTTPLREQFLMRSVNRVFILSENPRRLEAPLHIKRSAGKLSPLGVWYSLVNSPDSFFVFTIVENGVLAVCGASVSPDGLVPEIIPLSVHAAQVVKRLPPGLIQMYVRRIEAFVRTGENNE